MLEVGIKAPDFELPDQNGKIHRLSDYTGKKVILYFYPKDNTAGCMKYVCDVCGWEYDEEEGYPEGGIAPGTKWEDVPEDFECPLCNVGKDQFSEVEQKPNLVLNTDG